MKFLSYITAFILIISLNSCQSGNYIYIVRHAEKSSMPANDPNLTEQGRQRAEALKDFLKDKNIKAIYSTQTSRTIQTATPVSQFLNIPIQYYNNDTLNKFLQTVINLKKNTLIVAHSNTAIPMLNELNLPHTITNIPDNDFDNMFIVKVQNGKAIKLTETTYGAASPAE